MTKSEPQDRDSSGKTAPTFATDAEIEIAQELRHRLEERYLVPSSPWRVSPSQGD